MNLALYKELEVQRWVKEKGLNVLCHITYIDKYDYVKASKITLFYNETLLYNKQFIFECMLKGNVQLFEFDFVRDEISEFPLNLNLKMRDAYPDKLVFMKQRKRKGQSDGGGLTANQLLVENIREKSRARAQAQAQQDEQSDESSDNN